MDTKLREPKWCAVANPHREQLEKMLLEEQEAKIKQIKPEIEQVDYESVFYPEGVCSNSATRQQSCPLPQLWYLIEVLKKTGIFHLEQVGDKTGLIFLCNIIQQFKLYQKLSCYPGSCNYVCFLYNYFQKVSTDDWPAKNAILRKLEKRLPNMVQTRNKAEKRFNVWWLDVNSG